MRKGWVTAAVLAVVGLVVGFYVWSNQVQPRSNPIVLPTPSAVGLAVSRVGFDVENLVLRARDV